MIKSIGNVPEAVDASIQVSREILKQNKPRVYTKLMNYLENEKNGLKNLFLLDFVYDFSCNFLCSHCCAQAFSNLKNEKMSLETVKNIADEADAMGVVVFSLLGGEPLVWDELDELITVIDPNRFLITITTNGFLLTEDRARELKKAGVNKINVSIDSYISDEHDAFRNCKGSYARAMEAVENAKRVGLNVQVSTVATHQNLHTEGFQGMLRYSNEKQVVLDIKVATPTGLWLGNTEAMLNEEDANYLNQLREQYPYLRRDLFAMPGTTGGCPAVTNILYILPNGDVLPCIFIHYSLGNVLEEQLEDIRNRGLDIKEFTNFSGVCLAGEKSEFFDKYIVQTFEKKDFPIKFEK